MKGEIVYMIFFLLFFVLLIGGVVYLQIFFSKTTNKILGLILPIISFTMSLFFVMNLLAVYESPKTVQTTEETTDGVVTFLETIEIESEKTSFISSILLIIPVFIITNIPTLILIAIYYACKEKLKIKNQLDKMNIQDLE